MRHTCIVAWICVVFMAGLSSSPLAAAKDADKKPGAVPPLVSEEYHLGAGDKLRIEVYKDTQLSQSVQVRPDGKVTLPLIGDMDAAGLTPIELRDNIAKSLKEYVTNPTVTVKNAEVSGPTAASSGATATVSCPANTVLVGGGAFISNSFGIPASQGDHLTGDFPSDSSGNPVTSGSAGSWTAASHTGGQSSSGTATDVWALCGSQTY